MTDADWQSQLQQTDTQLRNLFQRHLTLTSKVKDEKLEENLLFQGLSDTEEETDTAYIRSFCQAVFSLSRDFRCGMPKNPMQSALRMIGADAAQMQTDEASFAKAVRFAFQYAGIEPDRKKAVIIGAGEEAEMLAQILNSIGVSSAGTELPENAEAFSDAEILVNATAIGAFPNNRASPARLERLPQCCGVLDFICDPVRTALVQSAQARGIPASGGLPVIAGLALAAVGRFSDTAATKLARQMEAERTNLILIGSSDCREEAAALSNLLGRETICMDDLIEESAGTSVSELLRDDGEPIYRYFERRSAQKAGAFKGVVISASSGIAADGRNYTALHQNGRIYSLFDGSLSAAAQQLEAEREPLCCAFADVRIARGRTPKETADAVLQEYKTYYGLK
jgi:shikimate dehydrogenase